MRKRVLLVDDEPDFTFMVAAALRQAGAYETREETDAQRVVPAAREFRPDVVLLDVMMPGLDGGDVAAALRADPATRDIPVVFVTALVGGEETPIGGMLSGGRRFIPKPVSFTELVQCIEEVTPAATAEVAAVAAA